MGRLRSHVSRNLNLNTLLIAVVGYFLKSGVERIDRNNDLLQNQIVRVEKLEQRVDHLETAREEHSREIQKLWDRKTF